MEGSIHIVTKHKLKTQIDVEYGADQPVQQTDLLIPDDTCLVFYGMALVNEQVVFKDAIKNCKDLASHVVQAVEQKSHHYTGAYVVFDDYNVQSSLKHRTRNLLTGGE